MKAYQNREDLLDAGPEVFLQQLWGNKPKEIKDAERAGKDRVSGGENEDDLDRNDLIQHGGEGLSGLLPDKGRTGMYSYKNIVACLEREFFSNPAIAPETKTEVARELIKYLETQRKNISLY